MRNVAEKVPLEMADQLMGPIGPGPLSQRLKVMMTGSHIRVSADLISAREVEKLIKILEANKSLLGDFDDGGEKNEAAGQPSETSENLSSDPHSF